ncbi:MAG: GNAT family N-acetyltransferase [Lachnospiraceae bacterium]|nr:GNAT family N-acetyltransferase [Lachnospiraceae bacterium]
MELKILNEKEIITVFYDRLQKDFAADEVKPLNVILKSVEDGVYECFGLFHEDRMLGYTFIVKQGERYLVDYLAVFSEYRNNGLGSKTLGLIRDHLSDAELVILEAEDPEYETDEELHDIQTRRIGFYKRNGLTDTGVRTRCFGVPFVILEVCRKTDMSDEEIWEEYRDFYRAMLPPKMFENNIEFLGMVNDRKRSAQ